MTKVRRCGDGQVVQTDLKIEARVSDRIISAQLISSDTEAVADIEVAASRTYERMIESLPAVARRDLLVEAGCVEQAITHEAKQVHLQRSNYLLTTCHGVVLALADEHAVVADSPWSASVDADEISEHLRVILGPSAALALIHHCLEIRAERGAAFQSLNPSISILEAKGSPYPPHVSPLNAWGNLRSRQQAGDIEDINNLVFDKPLHHTLLFHPERWGRPFAALVIDDITSLAINFNCSVPAPRFGLVLDTLTPLAARPGEIDWEAEFSLLGFDAGAAAGSAPLRLRFDPENVIARVCGAIGNPVPALASDPIAGERYGLAPMLATDLQAKNLC
jgi:hypothetical protein